MLLYTIIGWIGALVFILAYLLLSLQILSAKKKLYHVLNAIGGICLIINAVHLRDFPNLVVNAVWAVIALGAMGNLYYLKQKGIKK
ncbi:MAG: hypothetical protein V7724_18805 [Sediminicola sp.]|tara:strand:- start:45295 stop:45552 length:258 start_codon:yes stop_codon:yes gene_type:complete